MCTDHGHYLGEERADGTGTGRHLGQAEVPQFQPLGHIPLMIHWPGVAGGGVCDALTTNVDLHATLADVFGVTPQHRTHGRSLVPLLTGAAASVRDWAIGGVFGNWVQVTDGHRKYARAPSGDNLPLSMWSNRWSTMPVHVQGIAELPMPDERAFLDRMPGSSMPGDPPAVPAGRRAAVLGEPHASAASTTSTTSTSTPTSARTGSASRSSARCRTCCARRSPRSTPRPSSSSDSACT